jgi:hypothetical protein
MPLQARKIKRKIDDLFRRVDSEWEATTTAALGNSAGVVKSDVEGMIYARLRNGDTIKVYNDVAPDDYDLRVIIGRRKEQPTIWRVIAVRDSYSVPVAPRIKYHAEQHMFRSPDEIPINRKQIIQLTIIVSNGASFIVTVYGGVVHTSTGVTAVSSQAVDLSSYVPATGAVYVSIETDVNGVLSVHQGVNFASPAIAIASYVPVPASGKYMIGFVLLWEGMLELTDDEISVPFPLIGGASSDTGALKVYLNQTFTF